MSKVPFVIKLGGRLFDHADALQKLLQVCADIQTIRPLVLVHGGGDQVTAQLRALGFYPDSGEPKLAGQRITALEHLPVIAGVLAGDLNSQLCALAQQAQLNAVGLTLAAGNSISCQVDTSRGAVGVPAPNQPQLLQGLLDQGFTPIISSLGVAPDGQRLNVNADLAAAAVARLIGADLALLTDVEGILAANGDLIPNITSAEATPLIDSGVVQGGMLVKLTAALDTARASRRSIAVAGWRNASALIELAQGHHVGTRILL
ncbi:N-acetylglutamate kinase [Pseudidiomarina planktonica]|uniref:Acetylglutamate kinase n=1 Tax=Pseudidiomarina planktonica TaxID=1323738 RepID=A0A1Y6G224_9GAMM|nr:acetylglutamate kinase [Pseudidiomarina planktonica]RUO64002.1 acetylglutamate kinase [Pseudidiomarina planktonica]SMQ79906.1 N-acetylglutamate kinase [Pseudidiomarina planktonica]